MKYRDKVTALSHLQTVFSEMAYFWDATNAIYLLPILCMDCEIV